MNQAREVPRLVSTYLDQSIKKVIDRRIFKKKERMAKLPIEIPPPSFHFVVFEWQSEDLHFPNNQLVFAVPLTMRMPLKLNKPNIKGKGKQSKERERGVRVRVNIFQSSI